MCFASSVFANSTGAEASQNNLGSQSEGDRTEMWGSGATSCCASLSQAETHRQRITYHELCSVLSSW